MNREEVIALARESNISVFEDNTFADDMYISVLYRFANLIEERTLTNQKARYYQEGYESEIPKIPVESVMAVLSLVQKALSEGETEKALEILRDYWSFLDDFYSRG